MSTVINKQLVTDFFTRFVESDIDGLLFLLDDQVVWKMMGQQGGLPVSGEMDKAGITGLMESVRELIDGPLNMLPKAWTIEGNRVAVEVESSAILNNGRTYNNLYHYLIVINNGKIKTIKEYADTDQVRRVFLD
jgi:ketosteroid isomerase-like protein